MAELERMVGQKVQSLHERVTAKEDAFRVRLRQPSHALEVHCTSNMSPGRAALPAMLQGLIASPALLNDMPSCVCVMCPPASSGAARLHSSSAHIRARPQAVR